MTVSRRRTIQALAGAGGLAAMGGAVFAHGDYDDDERKPKDESKEKPPEAGVRAAHFSPDAPNVDVYVDGEQVISDLGYGEVTPYLEIAPGTYTVTITAASDPETVAFEDEVTIDAAFYTVAAIGELEASTFEPLVLVDAGSALVRLVHASPDAPAVDVAADGEVLFADVAFGEATDYVAVPAGAYTLDVRPAGTEEAVASFDVELELATAYSGFAIGYLDPDAPEDRAFTLEVAVDGPMAD